MKCQVLGFVRSSFTDEKSGQLISGYYIWVAYPSRRITGCLSKRLFLLDGKCSYIPQVEDMVMVSFNMYGKVEDIVSV